MNDEQSKYIKLFLNKCKILTVNIHDLHGMLIPREILLDNNNYDIVKEDISILRKLMYYIFILMLDINK